jgi:hypothetical protein
MADTFIAQEVYLAKQKRFVKTDVKPLTCHICKKELNGISITAKPLNGKMLFLCSYHYQSEPFQMVSVK